MMRRPLKQTTVILLILIFGLMASTDGRLSQAFAAERDGAPVKKPEARLSPEIPIDSDAESERSGWFGKYKWWLAASVVVIAGGVAAVFASGGDSDEDAADNGGDGGSPTQYRIDW